MKIIHSADIHLGSKITSKFPKEISEMIKSELRSSFLFMLDYAKENGIFAIILSGDVFDSDNPYKKDTDFFYRAVEANPDIEFFYLRGNHDCNGDTREIKNLKLFSEHWKSYQLGEVVITGVEIVRGNAEAIYSTIRLDEDKKNIVMLHGELGSETGVDKICQTKLRGKNIDYLALGHIHSYSSGMLDERADYAYPGCLVGRGFDECGEKGFIVLEVGERITHRFVSTGSFRIKTEEPDISGVSGIYDICKLADNLPLSRRDIYRINLVGEVDLEVDTCLSDVSSHLNKKCLYAEVKDLTKKKLNYSLYENDLSIKGEFVRLVRDSEELSEDEKNRILAYGLRALVGREVE